jgi:DNA modification methylase
MARPRAESPRDNFANVRLTSGERVEIESTARSMGLKSISEYVRHLHQLNTASAQQNRGLYEVSPQAMYDGNRLKRFFETRRGKIYHGDSLDYLFGQAKQESVDLIVTSPPFGLVRKKSYGNEDADDYCDWFRPFAEGFKRALKPNGSLVIDIGGAWKPGTPTRSLYHFELLVMLCKEYGFHLCQEHFWWNPSKLPTPAEWVNVRRVRVKDAVNCIWWLSPTPWPKASNRRVLAPYSDSMLDLLKNGYSARLRPSGHDISDKFQKNNGGAVPPNLLAIANTESSGKYQDHCRKNGLEIHPARFPAQLPEYFIRMLTNPGDLVVDPFAGSCVTGMVAEKLQRKWACIELSESYLKGALGRFDEASTQATADKSVQYVINAPCSLDIDETAALLPEDGGKIRPVLDAPAIRNPPRSKESKMRSRLVSNEIA